MSEFKKVCQVTDLIDNAGIPALLGNTPIALFYVKGKVYALDNFDPIGQASVISRGIVGSIKGQLVVASPLYKEHYDLVTGQCVEKPELKLAVFPVELRGAAGEEAVWVAQP
ncbi:nitrite reductase small subunit NirD [Thiomicrospira microaerophila]|uniref:nitrite reductase small subunit NirD n=1 Tax=Thiomicrospira microaerophila TaxID=406020 RepID=UPI00200CF8BC|nr:nitrite reductase small subunit NirD [Thiomicrospira microaerophila]UQB41491.1 nitrite reductase small subunit NirD [Thiomicrospira microaerophila]